METTVIPVEKSKQSQELEELQSAKFEAALASLVTGKTPKDVILQRPARGGMQVDYVPGWWFVEQLNALFQYNWDFDVIQESVGNEQVWVKGKLVVRGSGGVTVSKTQFGGSDVKKTKEGGKIVDIADDLKAAGTDSLKKCATLFGIASDVYGNREKLEQAGANRGQLDALYKVGEKVGMGKDAVDDYSVKKYGKEPKELETILVLGLMQELRKKEVNK